jgi:hypothetical protein
VPGWSVSQPSIHARGRTIRDLSRAARADRQQPLLTVSSIGLPTTLSGDSMRKNRGGWIGKMEKS